MRKRGIMVTMRVTPAELHELKAAAKTARLTVGEYIRGRLHLESTAAIRAAEAAVVAAGLRRPRTKKAA